MIESASDALRDGWGDQDFFGWPEPNTDCPGAGDDPAAHPLAALAVPPPGHHLPAAEARANGGNCLPPAGVDRSEGKATPSQLRDVPEFGARPPRQGHSEGR
jgi:hypothetical protein